MARIQVNDDPGYELSLRDSTVSFSDSARLATVLAFRCPESMRQTRRVALLAAMLAVREGPKKGSDLHAGIGAEERDERYGQEGKRDWLAMRQCCIGDDGQGIAAVFDDVFRGLRVYEAVPDDRQFEVPDQEQQPGS